MKRGIGYFVVVGALAGAFVLGRAYAQEEEEEQGGQDAAAAMAEMAAWMELGKPGPEHEHLKKAVGKWDCIVRSWDSPDAPPREEKGSTTFSSMFNGLLLKQEFQGSMMGMPFTGVGYNGFNKGSGKWESVWMDSMSSGIMYSTGEETVKGKEWTYTGHYYGPKGKKVESKMVLKWVNEDEQVMEMVSDMGEMGQHKMELVYKRVKDDEEEQEK